MAIVIPKYTYLFSHNTFTLRTIASENEYACKSNAVLYPKQFYLRLLHNLNLNSLIVIGDTPNADSNTKFRSIYTTLTAVCLLAICVYSLTQVCA